MPTVNVKRELLFEALGQEFTAAEFNDLCFEYGLELDDVVEEEQKAADGSVSNVTIYKIDIPANRYDLLCLEGISRALLVYQGKISIPQYTLAEAKGNLQQLTVRPATSGIRPYCVSAILRDITFTVDNYNSFIELQDKLHHNICRKRSLVAIGTHDLDTIEGPFIYDALPPEDIKFIPLNQTKEYTAAQLMDLYSKDSHLKPYLNIISHSPVFPVITDKNGVVLSLPPIINGEHSKITLDTKNVFIECTATDLTKAVIVLNIMCGMFSQYCASPFNIEPVEVLNPDGSRRIYPKLNYRDHIVTAGDVNKCLGIDVGNEEICSLLNKMALPTVVSGDELTVSVSPLRSDIMHAVDVYEDVAVAYGYNNIHKTLPKAFTIAQQFPLNKLSDQLREQVAQAGFTETLTFSLCSRDDIASKLGRDIACTAAVHIGNPKSQEFQVARTSLLPGLLKTVASNKKMPLPLRLFEVGDVVLKDATKDVGARNERRVCAVNSNKTPGFEVVHGLLDRIMQLLEVPHSKHVDGYHIRNSSDPAFFPGRSAEIVAFGSVVGELGVIHPDVLHKFDISAPVAALQLNIEPFL